jgi:lipoprotein NlpD
VKVSDPNSAIRRATPRIDWVCALVVAILIAACVTTPPRAPVSERTPQRPKPVVKAPEVRGDLYTVKKGDTLYSIALENAIDYRELAAMNNMTPTATLRVGQQLKIKKPAAVVDAAPADAEPEATTAPLAQVAPVVAAEIKESRAPATTPPRAVETEVKTEPKAVKVPYSEQVLAEAPPIEPQPQTDTPPPVVAKVDPKPEAAPDDGEDTLDFGWPTRGKIVVPFSDNAKGVDIAGKAGQPILATAAGKVVYSGTGLRGYGKLIIIKHNKTYLSAYAHNKDVFVKEGETVAKGQKIAEMGDSDAEQVKLHFEIRRQGKPVDPLRYLPPEKAS